MKKFLAKSSNSPVTKPTSRSNFPSLILFLHFVFQNYVQEYQSLTLSSARTPPTSHYCKSPRKKIYGFVVSADRYRLKMKQIRFEIPGSRRVTKRPRHHDKMSGTSARRQADPRDGIKFSFGERSRVTNYRYPAPPTSSDSSNRFSYRCSDFPRSEAWAPIVPPTSPQPPPATIQPCAFLRSVIVTQTVVEWRGNVPTIEIS